MTSTVKSHYKEILTKVMDINENSKQLFHSMQLHFENYFTTKLFLKDTKEQHISIMK